MDTISKAKRRHASKVETLRKFILDSVQWRAHRADLVRDIINKNEIWTGTRTVMDSKNEPLVLRFHQLIKAVANCDSKIAICKEMWKELVGSEWRDDLDCIGLSAVATKVISDPPKPAGAPTDPEVLEEMDMALNKQLVCCPMCYTVFVPLLDDRPSTSYDGDVWSDDMWLNHVCDHECTCHDH